jgi:dTDP-4-dehydrorhamnose reductase
MAHSHGTLRSDLTTPDGRALMVAAVLGAQPRAIVIAHGPSDVTWCEHEPDAALATHEGIAAAVSVMGVPVVLISTDNVFDGSKPRSTVVGPVRPPNAYGRARLAAQQAIGGRSGNVVLRVAPRSFSKQQVAAPAPVVCAASAGDRVAAQIVAVSIGQLARTAAALRLAASTPAGAGSVLTGRVLTGCAAFAAKVIRKRDPSHITALRWPSSP